MEKLSLTQEWDKVFPQSNLINHKKITFYNRYGIMLAADMYIPKNTSGKLPAIAISGPFGAVKEQSSGLYAQKMAEYGFLTIAFDPSFTGESGGSPRYVASPDINTEDFCAAVDFLSVQENVDTDQDSQPVIFAWIPIRMLLLFHSRNAQSRLWWLEKFHLWEYGFLQWHYPLLPR